MKAILRNLLMALIPLLAGLAVYFGLHSRAQAVPLLVFKVDVGSALAVTAGLVSLVLASGVIGWGWAARQGDRRLARRLAAERQAVEEARRRFIRRLDHELKNPLTGLRAALANLNPPACPPDSAAAPGAVPGIPVGDRFIHAGNSIAPGSSITAGSSVAAEALAGARTQVERLSRLVADLRKLSDLEERPLELAPVDLSEVLEEVVEATCALPQHTGRQVSLMISRVPWPLPTVTGDRDLLGLAFYNLVENALKYSSPGDAVEVRAREDGRWLIVEVADSGPGIAEEDLPRVFDELYRGVNARGLEGSGLGLALVRTIIVRHGGEATVRSRLAGTHGTLFGVRLPIKG